MKHGKKYEAALALIDKNKAYSIEEACELIKKTSTTKFDSSVGISFRLNVNTKKADQQIRGTVVLPNGTGRSVKVLVIAKGDHADAATKAGADYVGAEEMIAKIQQGWLDFDVCITTPDMMPVIGRIAKVLGPKGLMPNPKSGTVTTDVTKAIADVKAGKVEYRLDKSNIVHVMIGKKSFGTQKLLENFNTLMDAIVKAKPQAAKGQYIKSVSVSSTMGPGIKVDYKVM